MTFQEEVKNLSYFEGRVCTIFTLAINRHFKKDTQEIDYFVGLVDRVTELGIWTTHPTTKTKNFYFLNHVISISEEQVLDRNDPNYENIMKEFEEKRNKTYSQAPPSPPPQQQAPLPPPPDWMQEKNISPFVDVESLNKLAKKAKQRKSIYNEEV
jgi:hypothetical protein